MFHTLLSIINKTMYGENSSQFRILRAAYQRPKWPWLGFNQLKNRDSSAHEDKHNMHLFGTELRYTQFIRQPFDKYTRETKTEPVCKQKETTHSMAPFIFELPILNVEIDDFDLSVSLLVDRHWAWSHIILSGRRKEFFCPDTLSLNKNRAQWLRMKGGNLWRS